MISRIKAIPNKSGKSKGYLYQGLPTTPTLHQLMDQKEAGQTQGQKPDWTQLHNSNMDQPRGAPRPKCEMMESTNLVHMRYTKLSYPVDIEVMIFWRRSDSHL
ncbi:hypothetical protein DSO57_1020942 [Entomophthora muscae]|uniref:Uncharacterized protein n=1 Tax=Entomophthora muscae TaxID=34485 RepID=A0ACC2U220_9FUNG|nr:hypothetical protein DSO57_1020942 [Entomophthora muscae]